MKKLIPSLLFCSTLAGTLFAETKMSETHSAGNQPVSEAVSSKTSTPAGWTDDFAAAKKQAAEEGKLLLVDFSGSDWCGWCVRLDEEVFSKREFLDGVKDKFVLVFIDSPRDKSKLSANAESQNPKLLQKYGIRGFPTVLILDAAGEKIAQSGYVRGGPKNYLNHLDELLAAQKVITDLKELIKNLEPGSEERVKKIHGVLKTLPLREQYEQKNLVDEVLKFDGNGSAEMHAEYPFFTIVLPLEEDARELASQFYKDQEELYLKSTPEERKNPKFAEEVFCKVMKNHVAEIKALAQKVKAAKKQTTNKDAQNRLKRMSLQLATQLKYAGIEDAQSEEPQEGNETEPVFK